MKRPRHSDAQSDSAAERLGHVRNPRGAANKARARVQWLQQLFAAAAVGVGMLPAGLLADELRVPRLIGANSSRQADRSVKISVAPYAPAAATSTASSAPADSQSARGTSPVVSAQYQEENLAPITNAPGIKSGGGRSGAASPTGGARSESSNLAPIINTAASLNSSAAPLSSKAMDEGKREKSNFAPIINTQPTSGVSPRSISAPTNGTKSDSTNFAPIINAQPTSGVSSRSVPAPINGTKSDSTNFAPITNATGLIAQDAPIVTSTASVGSKNESSQFAPVTNAPARMASGTTNVRPQSSAAARVEKSQLAPIISVPALLPDEPAPIDRVDSPARFAPTKETSPDAADIPTGDTAIAESSDRRDQADGAKDDQATPKSSSTRVNPVRADAPMELGGWVPGSSTPAPLATERTQPPAPILAERTQPPAPILDAPGLDMQTAASPSLHAVDVATKTMVDPMNRISRGQLAPLDSNPRLLQVPPKKTIQVRTELAVRRLEIEDPRICETLQFSPGEVSIVGKLPGETRLAVWLAGTSDPVIWCVRVGAETKGIENQSDAALKRLVAELFPRSRIKLTLMDEKLIVEGQAKDRQEAVQILSFIRGVRVIPVVDRLIVRDR